MKLRLLLVGKPKDPDAGRLYDRYAGRIESLGVGCDTAWVAEVRAGGRFSDPHVREREARALAERLERDGSGTVVALDRSGRALSSRGVLLSTSARVWPARKSAWTSAAASLNHKGVGTDSESNVRSSRRSKCSLSDVGLLGRLALPRVERPKLQLRFPPRLNIPIRLPSSKKVFVVERN